MDPETRCISACTSRVYHIGTLVNQFWHVPWASRVCFDEPNELPCFTLDFLSAGNSFTSQRSSGPLALIPSEVPVAIMWNMVFSDGADQCWCNEKLAPRVARSLGVKSLTTSLRVWFALLCLLSALPMPKHLNLAVNLSVLQKHQLRLIATRLSFGFEIFICWTKEAF